MIHELKTWPEPFAAVLAGAKRFEVRRDDRGFGVGDRLVLREFDPDAARYSGRVIVAEVPYLVRGPSWGIPEGIVIMSLDVQVCVDLGDFPGAWEAFFEAYGKTSGILQGDVAGPK